MQADDARMIVERARREKLHRRIGALEAKLDKRLGRSLVSGRNRTFKLMGKIRRLKFELVQMEFRL